MTPSELTLANDVACTEDVCLICGALKDHWGQHPKAVIEAWTEKPGIMQDVFWVRHAEEI